MKKSACLVTVLGLVCLTGLSVFSAETARNNGPSLVKLSRSESAAAVLQKHNIPVSFKLAQWYIAEANQRDLEALHEDGIDYDVLDREAWSQPYYLINRPQQRSLGDIPDVGTVLYRSDAEAIMKIDEDRVLDLGRAGFRLTRLSQRSLPLEEKSISKPIRYRDTLDSGQVIEALVNQVSQTTTRAWVQRLQDYETRFVDTDSILASAQWLFDQFVALGYTDVEFVDFYITPHPFYYNVENAFVRNVIATKPGTLHPDDVYIIGGHYDSIVFDGVTDPRVYAPGADDNASAVAAVLEAARILADIDLDCTVKFACWTAEEVGLLGAWNYADTAYSHGENIELYLNLDMIANVDPEDPILDITIYRDPSSLAYADLMAEMAEQYTTLVPVQRDAGGGSDHVPFMQYGYHIVYGEEADFSPNWHEATDVIENMDFAYFCDVVKMSLATLVALAGPPESLPEPLITFEGLDVDDDDQGGSLGNGNGHCDPGETVEVSIVLHNYGEAQAPGVTGRLFSQDPFVTIEAGTQFFGDIPGSGSAFSGSPFRFHISEQAPNGYSVDFSLDVTASGGSEWTTYFTIPVEQPALRYRTFTFEETVGNGNGAFDAGETIALSVTIENSGLRSASGMTAVLQTDNPDVTIDDDQAVFPDTDIDAATVNDGDPFELSLDVNSEPQTLLFTLTITEGAGYYWTDLTFRMIVGQGKVLLVADDAQFDNRDYYTDAFTALGIPCDIEEKSHILAKSVSRDLMDYEDVIWFTGLAEKNTLTPEDQADLSAFLDDGGRLLLSGSLIGFDIGTTSFYREYLHARFVSFLTLLHRLNGTSNPMTAGMNITLSAEGPNAQGFAGETDPVGSAFSLFTYDRGTEEGPGAVKSSGSGALAVETSAYKLAYFSFGLEGIEPVTDRADVLAGVLTWFKSPGVDKGDVDGNGVINIIDALMAVNIVLGVHQATAEQIARADMNYDGGINVLDVIQVVNAILSGGGGRIRTDSESVE